MTNTAKFAFSHPTLTPIVGKSTSITIKLLLKEVYANARSVHSTHGGGATGNLGLAMSDAAYVIHVPATPFIAPAHPGGQPIHAAAATAAQITAVN
jgi:hypothetical protein